jgi:hypothetical protein
MTSGAVTQETAEASHSVGKDLPRSSQDARYVKRELSHDGIRAEFRRSERLTKEQELEGDVSFLCVFILCNRLIANEDISAFFGNQESRKALIQ